MTRSDKPLRVDLNSDLGEGFGVYKAGDDLAMLKLVTSANIACGFHAGDPEIMASCFSEARKLGVNVGAHPGFPDLWGFGRRFIPFKPAEIERLVAYQIGAAQALSTYAGNPITYVKAHGALSNLTDSDPDVALALCKAVKAVDRQLILMTYAGGSLDPLARDVGLKTCSEIYADRGYSEEGRIILRGRPGAMIVDIDEAARRVVRMVRNRGIETVAGELIETEVDTVCVHGDSPHSLKMAERVKAALEQEGIAIQRFA